MKQHLKILLPVISLAAIILSACNMPSSETATPTEGISAVYTAAAQTIVAQATLATATPEPTKTNTPTPSPSPMATATQSVSTIPTSPASQGACDNSAYISDVTIPDNTTVSPGQVFDKTWSLLNSGSCAWTTAYSITFVGGERMGGNSTAIAQAVPAQKQANVTVKLTAPTTAGTYTGFWRLANSQGSAFGQQVSVVIVVSGSAATATTGAATSTGAPAATQTSTTAAPSATLTSPAPSVTPTVAKTP